MYLECRLLERGADSAVIEIGTCCRFSSRRCADTTTLQAHPRASSTHRALRSGSSYSAAAHVGPLAPI